ncbi:MAG: HAMP domain-containing histidine kinase [Flavobacteriales bacterium]|nr:HAMP domain-containing histidine kinase [Flavobacteriales bacterium]
MAFLVLLVFFFWLFYLILHITVQQNIDEILSNRRNNIIELFRAKDGKVPADEFGFTDFRMRVTDTAMQDLYADTLIFEKTDIEFDEYRKLTSTFKFEEKLYRLEIVKAHLETEEIISTIVLSLVLTFLLMLGVFYFTTRYFSAKLWLPFHDTLNKLKAFELEKASKLVLSDSSVKEFNVLNKSILELIERTKNAFLNQKQFTENASHEMQTPLAVIQSQLEMWIGDPELTEARSEKIRMLLNAIQRLSKLNKTLLLLAKIDNQQFPDREKNDLRLLVEEILSYFEGQQENLKIDLALDLKPGAFVEANTMLLDVLLMNLIKNAFLHTNSEGSIRIKTTDSSFIIRNSPAGKEIPKDKLFQRFSKQSNSKESWGLGLAIARRICDINAWTLKYKFHNNEHVFEVHF